VPSWGRGPPLRCSAASLEEDEALTALSEVLGHGLLREVSEEDGRGTRTSMGSYIFGHDKMREVIYTEMGEAQRRLYHRRALAVCEALARPAAELAHHALAAGLAEQAWRFNLAAGEEAVRLLARVGAHLHYTQALAHLSRWEEAEMHLAANVQTLLSGEILLEAVRTRVALGLLCRDCGDLTSAHGHFEQAAAQFEASGLTRELEAVHSYLAEMGQS
jgi:predicted ATPase